MGSRLAIVSKWVYKEVMKKHLKIASLVMGGILLTGFTSAYLYNGVAHGDWDPTALEQQVQQNTSQLSNHEARITNAESNIKALQTNTNTAPASNPVAVPDSAAAQATQQTSQAASTSVVPVDWHSVSTQSACGGPITAVYVTTWSDGTTSQSSTNPNYGSSVSHTLDDSATSCAVN